MEIIREEKPDTVVLFGKKVREKLLNHLHFGTGYGVNHGEINEMIPGCPTRFFLLAFPSRKNEDSYSFSRKLEKFIKIREYLDKIHP
nr:hypothetical protein [Candidatus Sigynarchaeota archaeon]